MEGATSRSKLIGLWVLTALLAFAFLGAGINKVIGNEAVVGPLEDDLGVPSWALTVIGALEVAGAIGLLVNRTRFWAADGLALLMLGAVGTHLVNGDFAVPLVLGTLAGVLAWTQRPEGLLGRPVAGATA
ncbi:MAG: DoxX family protein [Thermoplasmatota archaeon]